MLRPDPLQEPRLAAIITNLQERIAEANQRGWLGEVDGLQVSLDAARQKLEQMRKALAQPPVVPLGTPTIWRPQDRRGSEGPRAVVADWQGCALPGGACAHPAV